MRVHSKLNENIFQTKDIDLSTFPPILFIMFLLLCMVSVIQSSSTLSSLRLWYVRHSVSQQPLWENAFLLLQKSISVSNNFNRFNDFLNFKFTYLLFYLWSWVLLEKPPIVQLLKNFPAFYGTRRFSAVFTRALHWSLSWAKSIQSIPSHPISILISPTHLRLGLPSGLFPPGFPTNIL
jgi:hypothetical protein